MLTKTETETRMMTEKLMPTETKTKPQILMQAKMKLAMMTLTKM